MKDNEKTNNENEQIKKLELELKRKDEIIVNSFKKFGRIFEQYAPFSSKLSKDEKEHLLFLGKPIDAISFCQDKILFIEIKTGKAFRTPNQDRVKKLIEEGKVEFREVRF